MGPYSEQKQNQRRALIEKILKTRGLPDDTKVIWKKHLNNLSVNEDEYNEKVRNIYGNLQPWSTIA